jgi:SAM-dependent methyltransferase
VTIARKPFADPAVEAASDTAAFVIDSVPRHTRAILDVGCGKGLVAMLLARAGYRVTGLDSSPAAVRAAARHGVRAVRANFADYETDERFDAILFSRSLHHMDDPRQALKRAKGLLVRGGRVLIEDFAIEDMDEASAAWILNLLRLLTAAGIAARRKRELPGERFPALAWWKQIHHADIHEGRAMIAAARSCFPAARIERAPYLYRYIVRHLAASAKSSLVLRHVRAMELASFGAAVRPLTGIRAVCR